LKVKGVGVYKGVLEFGIYIYNKQRPQFGV